MPEHLTAWPRPYYREPGGQPFLFYVVFGGFDADCEIGSREYRTIGVHASLDLGLYKRQEYPDVLSGFQVGYLWDELVTRDSALARRVAESDQCLILRGELEDQSDLDYFRDSVGLLTFFLDHGGARAYDPQMFRWSYPRDMMPPTRRPGNDRPPDPCDFPDTPPSRPVRYPEG
jgi:hypothetical protein